RRIGAGERLDEVLRINRLDQGEPASGQANLVGLQMADEVPLPSLHLTHLLQRLLDAVLAELAQAGLERLIADLRPKSFCNCDDRDLVRVASGPCDLVANGGEVLGDAHRKATMAPKRLPSGW